MPKNNKASSGASEASADTAHSMPEHLTRKATNQFGVQPLSRNQSSVIGSSGSPTKKPKSKNFPGSGHSDGASTASGHSQDNNPSLGIGGWVNTLERPGSNNNLLGGMGSPKRTSSMNNDNVVSALKKEKSVGGGIGRQSSSNFSGTTKEITRQGITNPDPTSYELPAKQYVRYADTRSSNASQSSDGDKYHYRNNQNPMSFDFGNEDDEKNRSGGGSSHRSGDEDSDDSLDEETGGSSNSSDDSGHTGSSHSSMSSNAKRTKEIANRPMMLYMIILMAVPILFLAIYQGIAVGNSEEALRFMKDHELVVEHMLDLQKELQEEVLVVSSLIGRRIAYNLSGEDPIPSWAPDVIREETATVNQYFTKTAFAMERLLRETARGDGRIEEFYHNNLALNEELALAEIAAMRNHGREYREKVLTIMSELSTMLAILTENDNTVLFRLELVDIQLLVRVEEQWANMFAMYLELEYSYNKSFDFLTNSASAAATAVTSRLRQTCLDFAASNSEMAGFLNFLQTGSGKANVERVVTEFKTTGQNFLLNAYRPFFDCDFRNATWQNEVDMSRSFHEEQEKFAAIQLVIFLEVVDNKEVRQDALTEGMKLFAAIVSCVAGLVIVIIVQKNERTELLSIIDHSEKLTVAVRRFVPKNQLRTMGVRTVLQVEPGLCVEVAQSLIFTEIRNFSQLSDQMSRIELFDWLQMYVARMTHVVQDQRGYVDAIMGDSLFSVFPQATYAVGAGIMMQQETDHMNVDLVAQKMSQLVRCGVGVHVGIVAAGVFGDHSRLSCTMVAADVNLASRLQGLTKVYGSRIILSRAVMEQIDVERFEIRRLAQVKTAGSDNSLEIFDLFQADPEPVKIFKLATIKDFEKAVAYSASEKPEDRQKAVKLFKKLKARADEMKVNDPSIPVKIREAEREGFDASSKITKEIVEKAAIGSSFHFNPDAGVAKQ